MTSYAHRTGDKRQITLYIDAALYAELAARANLADRSTSSLICSIITMWAVNHQTTLPAENTLQRNRRK